MRAIHADCPKTIYVYNKYYLDYDLEDVLRELYIQPQLQPPLEGVLRQKT